jgi:single-stranded-DNA-specific exonuclease
MLLPDMPQAVARIYRALLTGEKMAVYGDFDVDGITATALLVQGIGALGGMVEPYIPHRLQEGHGLNSYALNELKEKGVSLIITADCGVTGVEQVAKIARSRVDVIISDHHLPGDELPAAAAVVNPHRADSRYPFNELAGVGVAYKLLSALYRSMGREAEVEKYLYLVALGTVADMVPLLSENRFLVVQGLAGLKACCQPGIRELALQAGVNLEKISTENISWALAPRLNASGRLEHAITSYRLLMTESDEEARQLAIGLGEQNRERQRLTSAAYLLAREQVVSRGIGSILVASHTDFPGGILGLVAGKLTEEFNLPSVVIQLGDEVCHASCRSIPEFNINQALGQCAEHLSHFGGHAQAAGFGLAAGNLQAVLEKLNVIAAGELDGLDLRPKLEIDARVRLSDLTLAGYRLLQQMAPFGQDNPAPLFLSCGVRVVEARPMGSEGRHLRLKVQQGSITRDAVAFDVGARSEDMNVPLDIVYNFELDEWNGDSRLRLNIRDFTGSGTEI